MIPAFLGMVSSGPAISSATWTSGSGPFSDGNRTLSVDDSSNSYAATAAKTAGSWYAEVRLIGAARNNSVGFVVETGSYSPVMIGFGANEWGLVSGVGSKGSGSGLYNNNDQLVAQNYSGVVMLASNMASGRIWFGLNGTWLSGDPAAGTGAMVNYGRALASMFMACALDNIQGGSPASFTITDLLAYPIPSGFQPL
jgi:hypothetical protein